MTDGWTDGHKVKMGSLTESFFSSNVGYEQVQQFFNLGHSGDRQTQKQHGVVWRRSREEEGGGVRGRREWSPPQSLTLSTPPLGESE